MARVRWQGADRQSLALCHCSLWLKSPYLMLCAQRSISGFPNCKRREVCGAPGGWQGGLAVRRSSSRGRAINFCAAQSKVNVQVAKEDASVSLPCRAVPGLRRSCKARAASGVAVFLSEFTAALLSCSRSWESVLAPCSSDRRCSVQSG